MTGTSSFLPDRVRGMAGTASMRSGTWRGDSSDRSAPVMRVPQVVVELRAGCGRDEQDQLAHAVVVIVGGTLGVVEVHDQAVGDLGERLDDGVEVARAEAHAAPVQGGVGAARDGTGPVVGEGDPVAVAPHAGEVLEVGGAVPGPVGVAPEADRHRRHRAR